MMIQFLKKRAALIIHMWQILKLLGRGQVPFHGTAQAVKTMRVVSVFKFECKFKRNVLAPEIIPIDRNRFSLKCY